MPKRYSRYYASESVKSGDWRSSPQKDRDRILYTSALRRLAGVTQVISPVEGYVLHNRLTHTLEVAQIGRRIAEMLLTRYSEQLIAGIGGIDPDIVEAAALAHDLGHPPFGHVTEEILRELVDNPKVSSDEGFEGNAQSFRIVNSLSVRYSEIPGLNLTRATLDATLKYPWRRGENEQNLYKWGAYNSENLVFEWVRDGRWSSPAFSVNSPKKESPPSAAWRSPPARRESP